MTTDSKANTDTPDDSTVVDNLRDAYETVGAALGSLSLSSNTERFLSLQKEYFELKAALLARDEEFQDVDMDGKNIFVPELRRPGVDNPTATDTFGEVEMPTRDGEFSILDGFTVAKPSNPHTTYTVHMDHVISEDGGDVSVRINAGPEFDTLWQSEVLGEDTDNA